MKVAILVTDDFEESELMEPKKALENAGAGVTIIAPHSGEIQAIKHDEKSRKIKVDKTLSEVDPEEFDAVMLTGGALNADNLRMNEEAKEFVTMMDEENKPVAAICHAPWLLVSADLVGGRKLTSYYTIQDDIRNAGGDWEDEEVIEDDNWVSSRQPSDIPVFNKAMINLFARYSDITLASAAM